MSVRVTNENMRTDELVPLCLWEYISILIRPFRTGNIFNVNFDLTKRSSLTAAVRRGRADRDLGGTM